jgi:hypothetical protein
VGEPFFCIPREQHLRIQNFIKISMRAVCVCVWCASERASSSFEFGHWSWSREKLLNCITHTNERRRPGRQQQQQIFFHLSRCKHAFKIFIPEVALKNAEHIFSYCFPAVAAQTDFYMVSSPLICPHTNLSLYFIKIA